MSSWGNRLDGLGSSEKKKGVVELFSKINRKRPLQELIPTEYPRLTLEFLSLCMYVKNK